MSDQSQTPPNCFSLEEVQAFQAFENQILQGVNYYVWLHYDEQGAAHFRFLFAIQFVTGPEQALMVTSGQDSEAIQIMDNDELIDTARQLQQLHGRAMIQVIPASAQPLWADLIGQPLEAIRLSKDESGLYLNDALQLDFGTANITIALQQEGEGLTLLR